MLAKQCNQFFSSLSVPSLKASIIAVSVLSLSACGSGTGTGNTANGEDGVDKTETMPLDHLSNIDLQRSAASGSKQMQSGMNNAQSFATQPVLNDTMSGTTNFDLQQLLGMSGESSSSGEDTSLSTGVSDGGFSDEAYIDDDDMGATGTLNDDAYDNQNDVEYSDSIWDDTGVEQLIDITLGLVGNADITRDGNSMIIDPDDNEMCQHSALDMQENRDELQFCLAMVSDISVRIDGQTEDAGNISYLFQDEIVMQIEYALNSTLFKLRLPGVRTVMEKAYSLAPDEFFGIPDVFEGVIELGTRIDNEAVGSEAGAVTVAITSPIVVQDSDEGFSIRLAAADLLSFKHDNAAGTASIELDSRAFLYSFTDGQVIEFAGNGGTVKIDLINDGEQVSVSKLGLGNGPLTVTVDSVEVVKMTLDTFGFDIDNIAQQLVLTGDLSFELMIDLYGSLFGEPESADTVSINAAVTAPANALFSAQSNGSVKLDNAGPFTVDWFASFGGENTSASFVASPGECFTEGSDDNALFSQVVCE